MASTTIGHDHPKDEYPAEGLQAWVILVCLGFIALACFMLLRFTMDMMDVKSSPAPQTTAVAPAP